MKQKKFLDFIITQNCTYRCKYCSQSKNETHNFNSATRETIDNFLKLLDEISCDYEITITGGEALLHPEFFNLIQEVKNRNFKLSLITNFSFGIDKYKKIFEILEEYLVSFSISFHLDEIKDFDEVLEKLKSLLAIKNKETKLNFLIPIYKITPEKEQKIDKIIRFANKNEIDFDFQHIRILNKHIDYSEKEKKYIKETKKEKTFANYCSAGYLSAVIYENGDVYRCYSSRFLKSNYLGNLNDKDFKLNEKNLPCIQKHCTCPKPKLYNQILPQKNYILASFIAMVNLFYLPAKLLKNKNIIKRKLAQLIKTH